MYYKFIDNEGKICGLACGGDPEAEGAERIEITEEEYIQLLTDLIAAVAKENIINDDSNKE